MNFYRQPILLFGIVLPIVGTIILLALCALLKANIVSRFAEKQQGYQSAERDRIAALQIETLISRQRPHLKRWEAALTEETAGTVTNQLRSIAETLPTKEYQMTAFERPGTTGGFGSVSAQKSSQVRIAFRGTYRTVQRAFLELESRMPQLQLQEFRMDPSPNNPSQLNFQVTYTAWEN